MWCGRSRLKPGIPFLVAKIRRILGLRGVLRIAMHGGRWGWGITNIAENHVLTNCVTFLLGNFSANFLGHVVAVLLGELLTFFPKNLMLEKSES